MNSMHFSFSTICRWTHGFVGRWISRETHTCALRMYLHLCVQTRSGEYWSRRMCRDEQARTDEYKRAGNARVEEKRAGKRSVIRWSLGSRTEIQATRPLRVSCRSNRRADPPSDRFSSRRILFHRYLVLFLVFGWKKRRAKRLSFPSKISNL